MNYPVKIDSLYENFPSHFEVPSSLVDFGDWLKDKPVGSLGHFSLQSERFNDYWIENGADLHPYFAFFVRDPTGGQIGYWLYEGRKMTSPPIVLVGSEGELKIIGNTLEEFLEKLAEGKTEVPDLDSRDEGGEEETGLASWLKSRTDKTPTQSFRDIPDLEQWIEKWGQEQREWIDKDSAHLHIAEKLLKYVKPNAKLWETANFDVLLIGPQFKIWHRLYGLKPLPEEEIADLEPLFRSVREQRACKIPERGLWFTAWVTLGSQGALTLSCNFMDKPKIKDEKLDIPADDYALDLKAFPRSKHWMPKWLRRAIEGA